MKFFGAALSLVLSNLLGGPHIIVSADNSTIQDEQFDDCNILNVDAGLDTFGTRHGPFDTISAAESGDFFNINNMYMAIGYKQQTTGGTVYTCQLTCDESCSTYTLRANFASEQQTSFEVPIPGSFIDEGPGCPRTVTMISPGDGYYLGCAAAAVGVDIAGKISNGYLVCSVGGRSGITTNLGEESVRGSIWRWITSIFNNNDDEGGLHHGRRLLDKYIRGGVAGGGAPKSESISPEATTSASN